MQGRDSKGEFGRFDYIQRATGVLRSSRLQSVTDEKL